MPINKKQDAILAASNYDMVIDIDMAIDPSWAGKDPKLDSVVQSACSSRVNLEKKLWEAALRGAQEV
jgi:hypothetical protein